MIRPSPYLGDALTQGLVAQAMPVLLNRDLTPRQMESIRAAVARGASAVSQATDPGPSNNTASDTVEVFGQWRVTVDSLALHANPPHARAMGSSGADGYPQPADSTPTRPPSYLLFSFFCFRFSLSVNFAFFCVSFLPLSFFPLSPIFYLLSHDVIRL